MAKAATKKSTPQSGVLANFPNQQLVHDIEKLKTAAARAQGIVDRSHDALYRVLANCLALTATFGKDCSEFKRGVRNNEGVHEYREDAPGMSPNPFKPVIWQVFKNPPRQALYRYTSALTLIETEAGEKNIDLQDKEAIVALMKAHRSIDRMVGLVKKKRDTQPIDPATQRAEWAAKIRKVIAALEKRDIVTLVDPEKTKVQAEGTFSLFAGTWTKDGKIKIVSLDAVGNPEDQEVVDIWSAQQKELRDAVDLPTAFLAELTKLAKAIKEPKRPRNDQEIARSYFRRIRFDPDNNRTVAKVGLVDNDEHPSLIATTRFFRFPLSSPACVYRTPTENHEDILFAGAKRNPKDLENVVRCEGEPRGKEDRGRGVVGRLIFGGEDDPEEVLLVDPDKLAGKQTLGRDRRWDFKCDLDRAALAGLKAHLEAYRKDWTASLKSQGKKTAKNKGQPDPKTQGLPITFEVSGGGLMIRSLVGKGGHQVSNGETETDNTKAFDLSFRSDDWLACVRAMSRVGGIEQAGLRLSQNGSCKLSVVGAYGDYSFFLPAIVPAQ